MLAKHRSRPFASCCSTLLRFPVERTPSRPVFYLGRPTLLCRRTFLVWFCFECIIPPKAVVPRTLCVSRYRLTSFLPMSWVVSCTPTLPFATLLCNALEWISAADVIFQWVLFRVTTWSLDHIPRSGVDVPGVNERRYLFLGLSLLPDVLKTAVCAFFICSSPNSPLDRRSRSLSLSQAQMCPEYTCKTHMKKRNFVPPDANRGRVLEVTRVLNSRVCCFNTVQSMPSQLFPCLVRAPKHQSQPLFSTSIFFSRAQTTASHPDHTMQQQH